MPLNITAEIRKNISHHSEEMRVNLYESSVIKDFKEFTNSGADRFSRNKDRVIEELIDGNYIVVTMKGGGVLFCIFPENLVTENIVDSIAGQARWTFVLNEPNNFQRCLGSRVVRVNIPEVGNTYVLGFSHSEYGIEEVDNEKDISIRGQLTDIRKELSVLDALQNEIKDIKEAMKINAALLEADSNE